jgi:CRP-like cAMP-binding protein
MNLLHLFDEAADAVSYPPGACIFAEGQPGDTMFVVVEGRVALSVRGTRLEIISAGELFGEMALIDARPRSATATAITACRLAGINERRFTALVQQTPFFALHVMRVLARRLRAMDDTIG